jgi:hypothetical protein
MPRANDFIGKVKRVKIDGFYVDIPKGLSEADEAAMIADLTDRIANDVTIQSRKRLADERRARFDARVAKARELAYQEQTEARAKLNGGDNPAQ